MSDKTVFCPVCREDVEFAVLKNKETPILKGEVYEFVSQKAYCEKCASEVYVAKIEDDNLKALYDVYRQKNDIVSLEEIRAIPKKYGIGKRPLSLLLGWGEQTFSRYYDGDLPTKQYSEILKKIYSDPGYYLSLLESNREKLMSDKTYKKSLAVTKNLPDLSVGKRSKLDATVDYFVEMSRHHTSSPAKSALLCSGLPFCVLPVILIC